MKSGDVTPVHPCRRTGSIGRVAPGNPRSVSKKLKRKPSKESAAASGVDSKEDDEDSRAWRRRGGV